MSDPSEKFGVVACAICGKQVSSKFAPFCSRRWGELDLSRWLKGIYVIPAPLEEEAESMDSRDSSPPQTDKD